MKNLKRSAFALSILIALLCAGCSEVTPAQLKHANDICTDKGGVRTIIAYSMKKNVVHCMDDTAEFM